MKGKALMNVLSEPRNVPMKRALADSRNRHAGVRMTDVQSLFVRACGTAFALIYLGIACPSFAGERVRYVHTDALGSPVAITDTAGVTIERQVYEPYGAEVGGPRKDGAGYTGQMSDAETDLVYMQQRYLDAELGMLLSIDPIDVHNGDEGHFNRYRYANSNPYRYIDPDGRRACGKDTTCQLEQGATGGALMVNPDGAERSQSSAAKVGASATNAANAALAGLKGKSFKSAGSAGRAWSDRVRRVADKYDTEIASRLFYGADGIVLGTATSEGFRFSVNPSFSEGPFGLPTAGFIHTHPYSRLFSGNDLTYAIKQYQSVNGRLSRTGLDQSAMVSLPDGRVIEWRVSSYVRDGAKAYLNEAYYNEH